jgi:hypothetical protein
MYQVRVIWHVCVLLKELKKEKQLVLLEEQLQKQDHLLKQELYLVQWLLLIV